MGPFIWEEFVQEGIWEEELYDLFYWPLNFTFADSNEDGNVDYEEHQSAEYEWEMFLEELDEAEQAEIQALIDAEQAALLESEVDAPVEEVEEPAELPSAWETAVIMLEEAGVDASSIID